MAFQRTNELVYKYYWMHLTHHYYLEEPISILGAPGVFFFFFFFFHFSFLFHCSMKFLYAKCLARDETPGVLRRLSLGYTVCLCPKIKRVSKNHKAITYTKHNYCFFYLTELSVNAVRCTDK